MSNQLSEFEINNDFFKLTYSKAILYIFIFLIGIIPAGFVDGFFREFVHLPEDLQKGISTVTNVLPFIFVIISAYFWSKKDKMNLRYNFTPSFKLIPIITMLMLFVMMLSSYTTTFVPHDSGWLKYYYDLFESMFKDLMDPKWALVLSTCVFAPLFEEILFRGILLKGLINNSDNETDVWYAILFTSFMFGLVHMNPWQFIAAMISGIALGYVYYRTKSLGNTIFMHALNNGISVYVLFKYDEMEPSVLTNYPGLYNLLYLTGFILFMYLVYYFTKNNRTMKIK